MGCGETDAGVVSSEDGEEPSQTVGDISSWFDEMQRYSGLVVFCIQYLIEGYVRSSVHDHNYQSE